MTISYFSNKLFYCLQFLVIVEKRSVALNILLFFKTILSFNIK